MLNYKEKLKGVSPSKTIKLPSVRRTRSTEKADYTKTLSNKVALFKKRFQQEKKQITPLPSEFDLAPLEGEITSKGPISYSNQIFVDVFDSSGNHDKVLENEDSVELFENFAELKAQYLLVKKDPKVEQEESIEQVKGFRFDFTAKPKVDVGLECTYDLTKPLSIGRHLHKDFQN